MGLLDHKTAVITGANSGIGFETAAALASMNARVLITARNADKGRAAVAAIDWPSKEIERTMSC